MAAIILLDDDEMLRTSLAETLEAEGHSVTQSNNGLAAFNLQEMGALDLMITDLYMPRVDGIEAIIGARRDFPDLRIIAMSGGADFLKQDFLPYTVKLGAAAILRKPFKTNVFLDTVRRVLSVPAGMDHLRPIQAKAS